MNDWKVYGTTLITERDIIEAVYDIKANKLMGVCTREVIFEKYKRNYNTKFLSYWNELNSFMIIGYSSTSFAILLNARDIKLT